MRGVNGLGNSKPYQYSHLELLQHSKKRCITAVTDSLSWSARLVEISQNTIMIAITKYMTVQYARKRLNSHKSTRRGLIIYSDMYSQAPM